MAMNPQTGYDSLMMQYQKAINGGVGGDNSATGGMVPPMGGNAMSTMGRPLAGAASSGSMMAGAGGMAPRASSLASAFGGTSLGSGATSVAKTPAVTAARVPAVAAPTASALPAGLADVIGKLTGTVTGGSTNPLADVIAKLTVGGASVPNASARGTSSTPSTGLSGLDAILGPGAGRIVEGMIGNSAGQPSAASKGTGGTTSKAIDWTSIISTLLGGGGGGGGGGGIDGNWLDFLREKIGGVADAVTDSLGYLGDDPIIKAQNKVMEAYNLAAGAPSYNRDLNYTRSQPVYAGLMGNGPMGVNMWGNRTAGSLDKAGSMADQFRSGFNAGGMFDPARAQAAFGQASQQGIANQGLLDDAMRYINAGSGAGNWLGQADTFGRGLQAQFNAGSGANPWNNAALGQSAANTGVMDQLRAGLQAGGEFDPARALQAYQTGMDPRVNSMAQGAASGATSMFGQSMQELAAQQARDSVRNMSAQMGGGGLFNTRSGASMASLQRGAVEPLLQAQTAVNQMYSDAYRGAYEPAAQMGMAAQYQRPEQLNAALQSGIGLQGAQLGGADVASQDFARRMAAGTGIQSGLLGGAQTATQDYATGADARLGGVGQGLGIQQGFAGIGSGLTADRDAQMRNFLGGMSAYNDQAKTAAGYGSSLMGLLAGQAEPAIMMPGFTQPKSTDVGGLLGGIASILKLIPGL